MIPKKVIFGIIFLLVLTVNSFAGEMATKESVICFNEGVRAQKSGELSKAMSAYQKALYMDPYDESGYRKEIMNNVACMYAKVGDMDKAIEAFEQIIAFDPHNKLANLNLGLIYNKNGERCRALECWARIVEEPTDFVAAEPREEVPVFSSGKDSKEQKDLK